MAWEANDLLNNTGPIKKLQGILLFLYAKATSIALCKLVLDLFHLTVPGS